MCLNERSLILLSMWSCKFYKFRQVKYLAPLTVKPLDIELNADVPPGYDNLTLARTLPRIVKVFSSQKLCT